MPNSDKNILITPNIGSTNDPKIDFVGASTNTGPSTITATVYSTNNGTLSFDGTAGSLFSISNNLATGSIFSVNPISGIPIIDVNADRTVALNPYGGNTGIGTTNPSQKLVVSGITLINTNSTTGTASQPLQVSGGAYISGSVGIGITNPVGLTTGSSQTLHLDGADAVLRVGPYYATQGDRDCVLVVSQGTDSYIRSNNERFHIYNDRGDVVIHAGANDTERLRVLSTGNIGIATTNPVGRLHSVAATTSSALTLSTPDTGNARLTHLLGGNNYAYGVIGIVAGDGTQFGDAYGLGSSSNPTGSWSPTLTWTTQLGQNVPGRIGIGTTNPSSQLHITGQFQSTQANSTATGGGQIYLNGATGNRIDFNINGVAAPAFTTRSAGTKIVLYPTIAASLVDYAFGIDTGTLWSSVPDSTHQFRWYAGTTNIATLSGTGSLSIGGGVSGATATPARLDLGNSYSNGATRDKCKIYLYNSGTEQYGFSVGSNADIQHHSNGIHEFYIGNTSAVRINNNRNLLIGSQTDTGTASQTLQVTGGAYVSGNTGIGTTNPRALLSIGSVSGFQDTTTTLATTTATTIDSFSTTVFRSARVQVQISQSTNYQVSDVLVIHDGTTASIVEYASVATNDYIGSLTATVSGGNCLLQVSMLTATSTTVKVLSQRVTI